MNYAGNAHLYCVKRMACGKLKKDEGDRGARTRGFPGAFLSENPKGGPQDVEKCAIAKTNFVLENFARFRNNFDARKDSLIEADPIKLGNIRNRGF